MGKIEGLRKTIARHRSVAIGGGGVVVIAIVGGLALMSLGSRPTAGGPSLSTSPSAIAQLTASPTPVSTASPTPSSSRLASPTPVPTPSPVPTPMPTPPQLATASLASVDPNALQTPKVLATVPCAIDLTVRPVVSGGLFYALCGLDTIVAIDLKTDRIARTYSLNLPEPKHCEMACVMSGVTAIAVNQGLWVELYLPTNSSPSSVVRFSLGSNRITRTLPNTTLMGAGFGDIWINDPTYGVSAIYPNGNRDTRFQEAVPPGSLVEACGSIWAWGLDQDNSAIARQNRYGRTIWQGREAGWILEIHQAGNECWALVQVPQTDYSDKYCFARLGQSGVDSRSPLFDSPIITLGETYWLRSAGLIRQLDPTTWTLRAGGWLLPDKQNGFLIEVGGQVWASSGANLVRLNIPLI